MKSNVLILSRRYSSDSQILYNAALSNNWKVWRFVSDEIPSWLRENDVSIYCETAFADHLAAELNIELLSPSDAMLADLPFDFVKRDIQFTRYKDFVRPEAKKFIKPADYKYFPAGVYGLEDTIPGFSYCQDNDPILISDVVMFVNEYRLFILNDRLETGSIYVRDSQFIGDQEIDDDLPQNLVQFADQVLNHIKGNMPASYVLDIGQLDTGEYAVIEFNPTWASGFYGADVGKVLECIQGACCKKL